MKISILTLFPEMFQGPFDHSIIKHAQQKKLVEIDYVNIREFGIGSHQMVDDTPYGGGIGMVLRVDVLYQAIMTTKKAFQPSDSGTKSTTANTMKQLVVLLSAQGCTYTQQTAKKYVDEIDHLILLCGHYEGVDERIKEYIDAEISIGDFILTGGELPAMLIVDSITRLIPGVLKEGAAAHESFSYLADNGEYALLEYPHYTRPQSFLGKDVPEILTQGDHKKIAAWRQEQAKLRTQHIRPDLLKTVK